MLWRQGDVFIADVPVIPGQAVSQAHCVLAEGEATGHRHRVSDPFSAVVFADRSQLFLKVVAETATIVHDEHGPIELPRGTYRVWQQREYDPSNQFRFVRD